VVQISPSQHDWFPSQGWPAFRHWPPPVALTERSSVSATATNPLPKTVRIFLRFIFCPFSLRRIDFPAPAGQSGRLSVQANDGNVISEACHELIELGPMI
jgi:hypothetical protein